jgi:hypothetical protein
MASLASVRLDSRPNLLLKHALTPEERAYIAYCDWCGFLDLTPADLETWRKATKNLSETNYSGPEPKRRSGRDVIR